MKRKKNKITLKTKYLRWIYYVMLVTAMAFFVFRAIQMIRKNSVALAYPGATLYLIDYNFYYGTRTFIGSLISLFTHHITYQQIFTLNICVYIATTCAFCGMGIFTLKKSIKENNTFLFFTVLLFLVFPYSILRYANWIGIYEVYLALGSALCSMIAGKKYIHWLCPAIFVMAIFTHHSFVLIYFPAIFSIQLYHILQSGFKKSYIASTATGLLFTFISTVYCVFFADRTIKMTRDELFSYMQDRLGLPPMNKGYIDVYYFREKTNSFSIFTEKELTPEFLRNFFLFFLPVMLLFAGLWFYYIISKEKIQFICGIFFLLTLFAGIVLVFLMDEEPRWQTSATLSQFLLLFTLINNKDPVLENSLKKKNKKPVNITMAILVIYCIIANFIIQPYFSDPSMIARINQ